MIDSTEKIFDSEVMKSNFTSADSIEEEEESSISHEKKKSCTICGTSKTPLWRSGPAGPKSLCNACGIRNRKKRRTVIGNRNEDKKKTKKKKNQRWKQLSLMLLRQRFLNQ